MIRFLLYVDPGSGGYLIQAIIAAVLGAAFYFKTAWWRFKSFFTRKKETDQEKDEPTD